MQQPRPPSTHMSKVGTRCAGQRTPSPWCLRCASPASGTARPAAPATRSSRTSQSPAQRGQAQAGVAGAGATRAAHVPLKLLPGWLQAFRALVRCGPRARGSANDGQHSWRRAPCCPPKPAQWAHRGPRRPHAIHQQHHPSPTHLAEGGVHHRLARVDGRDPAPEGGACWQGAVRLSTERRGGEELGGGAERMHCPSAPNRDAQTALVPTVSGLPACQAGLPCVPLPPASRQAGPHLQISSWFSTMNLRMMRSRRRRCAKLEPRHSWPAALARATRSRTCRAEGRQPRLVEGGDCPTPGSGSLSARWHAGQQPAYLHPRRYPPCLSRAPHSAPFRLCVPQASVAAWQHAHHLPPAPHHPPASSCRLDQAFPNLFGAHGWHVAQQFLGPRVHAGNLVLRGTARLARRPPRSAHCCLACSVVKGRLLGIGQPRYEPPAISLIGAGG